VARGGSHRTVARATLLSSSQLALISHVKLYLSDSGYFGPNGQWMGGLSMMFCAMLCSSFCANIVANPFDVVKSRMQKLFIEADGTKSIRADGLMILYAGFTPAFVKLAPFSITISCFDLGGQIDQGRSDGEGCIIL
jgi:hypothetical protein